MTESRWRTALRAQGRFLTFTPIRHQMAEAPREILVVGLAATWLAGIGRYWDAPVAQWWQFAGLGSLAYVFVLAAILWLVAFPVSVRRLGYVHWLTFVALTAAPAILYAVPVERFMSLDGARSANIWFLGIVALWRVALLLHHWADVAGTGCFGSLVATILPVNAIVVLLVMLNLEEATFELMGGLEREPTVADERYGFLVLLSWLSVMALPLVLISYAVLCVNAMQVRRRALREAVPQDEVEG